MYIYIYYIYMYNAYMPFRRSLDNNTQNILTRQKKTLLGIQVVFFFPGEKFSPKNDENKNTSGFEFEHFSPYLRQVTP